MRDHDYTTHIQSAMTIFNAVCKTGDNQRALAQKLHMMHKAGATEQEKLIQVAYEIQEGLEFGRWLTSDAVAVLYPTD